MARFLETISRRTSNNQVLPCPFALYLFGRSSFRTRNNRVLVWSLVFFVTFVNGLSPLSFSDLLYLPVSLPRFVIFVIFAVTIFVICVAFVKPPSLLSFSDLFYLPVSFS